VNDLPAPAASPGTPERTILVVDDDAILLRALEGILGRLGRVVSCNSSVQAVELLYEGLKPEIILADYQMPELTGLELLFESMDYAPDAIRIVMTGLSGLKDVLEGLNQGCIHVYLCKPWRVEDFLETMRQCLEQAHLESRHRALRAELASQEARLADLRARLRDFNEKLAARRGVGHAHLRRTAAVFGALLGDHGAHATPHARFVARAAAAVAEACGLSRQERLDIELAAALHDVGKALLPEAVREADPRLLSDADYALYQTHPARAADLLGGPAFLARVCEIVARHHERTDGTGFPAGLRGRQVTRESQIVAMADLYHNLTQRIGPGDEAGTEGEEPPALPDWRVEMGRQEAASWFRAQRSLFDVRAYDAFWAVAQAGTVPDFVLPAASSAPLHLQPASSP